MPSQYTIPNAPYTQDKVLTNADLHESHRCHICLEDHHKDEVVVQLKWCNHFFCKACMQTFFSQTFWQYDCPMCKEPTKKYEILNVIKEKMKKLEQHLVPGQHSIVALDAMALLLSVREDILQSGALVLEWNSQ